MLLRIVYFPCFLKKVAVVQTSPVATGAATTGGSGDVLAVRINATATVAHTTIGNLADVPNNNY